MSNATCMSSSLTPKVNSHSNICTETQKQLLILLTALLLPLTFWNNAADISGVSSTWLIFFLIPYFDGQLKALLHHLS